MDIYSLLPIYAIPILESHPSNVLDVKCYGVLEITLKQRIKAV